MKILENVTLYKCDFCPKELKRKHALLAHENQCNKNPINHRPCLNGCMHLITKDIEFDAGRNYNGDEITRDAKAFYCNLKNTFILHPKLQYKKWWQTLEYVTHEHKEVKQEWMPKECVDYIYGFNILSN